MIRKLGTVLLAVLLLAGCAKEKIELTETEEGTISASIENGKKESSATTGALHVTEEDIVVISPDFKKGEVNVVLKDATGNISLNEVISGRQLTTYEVDPGTYDVTVTVLETTTGTMTIVSQNREEYEKISEALEKELEQIEN